MQKINLNIHYSAPESVWNMVNEAFRSMPYWSAHECGIRALGANIDLVASIEPSGLQISGIMPDEIWSKWFEDLKHNLTNALGYEIGEPEDGFDFVYW